MQHGSGSNFPTARRPCSGHSVRIVMQTNCSFALVNRGISGVPIHRAACMTSKA